VSRSEHPFTGEHLLLRFERCEADLDDMESIEAAMREAVLASGAEIRGVARARFEPRGLSVVLILAESHASVHTYPDERSAFLDIFTCGTRCEPRRFDEVLRRRLLPAEVSVQSIQR